MTEPHNNPDHPDAGYRAREEEVREANEYPPLPISEIPDWYEDVERRLVREYIKPHHRVLEIGAGMGAVTHELTVQAEFVVAFEPQTFAAATALQNAPEAVVFQGAIGAGGETMTLHLQEKFWASGYQPYSACGSSLLTVNIPTAPINDVVDFFDVNAIVMDNEGYEGPILHTLDLKPIEILVVELHPQLMDGDLVMGAMTRMEYPQELPNYELGPTFHRAKWLPDRDTIHAVWTRVKEDQKEAEATSG